jgi:hypothetical protein
VNIEAVIAALGGRFDAILGLYSRAGNQTIATRG